MKPIFFIALLIAGITHAQEPQSTALNLESTTSHKPKKPIKTDRPSPCAVIERACKAGGHTKFLYRDCVQHIIDGHDVPGVSIGDVSLQQIKACKMFKQDNLRH